MTFEDAQHSTQLGQHLVDGPRGGHRVQYPARDAGHERSRRACGGNVSEDRKAGTQRVLSGSAKSWNGWKEWLLNGYFYMERPMACV
eukprot:86159-Pelagomonas_calceolata.AAC.5